jgi:hypothetical protein
MLMNYTSTDARNQDFKLFTGMFSSSLSLEFRRLPMLVTHRQIYCNTRRPLKNVLVYNATNGEQQSYAKDLDP